MDRSLTSAPTGSNSISGGASLSGVDRQSGATTSAASNSATGTLAESGPNHAAADFSLYAGGLAHHLTALTLTACDGMCGSTIPLLRGLRHLRLSFCASITRQAVQQVVLSCSKLVLLELPPELQQQLATAPYGRIHTSGGFAVQFGASAASRSAASSSAMPHHLVSDHRGRFSSGSGGGGGSRGLSAAQSSSPAGLPQQGPGGHLHGLKVVCS
jgi:hypothetical protein